MATTRKKGLPTVWITNAVALASGMNQCEWKGWYAARFKYDKLKSDFDFDAWSAEHDSLVKARISEFIADDWKCRVEAENWTRLQGETAVLIGKMDIVAERGGQFIIADGKTGDPNRKDFWQMCAYLYMLPKAWGNANLRVTGQLFYKSGQRIDVHPSEFTDAMKKTFFGVVRRMGESAEPKRTPSQQECGFCDLAECPERFKPIETIPATADF